MVGVNRQYLLPPFPIQADISFGIPTRLAVGWAWGWTGVRGGIGVYMCLTVVENLPHYTPTLPTSTFFLLPPPVLFFSTYSTPQTLGVCFFLVGSIPRLLCD